MAFSVKIKEDALVACGRTCCICHNFCGPYMELHHIKQHALGGEDTFENCIPLCLNCHAQVKAYDPKHPKGTKYTEAELIRHRDAWYAKVRATGSYSANTDYVELDTGVFNQLNKYLPISLLEVLRDRSFDGLVLPANAFDSLEHFTFLCRRPELEFLDSDLETAKVSLHNAITTFFEVTFPYLFSDDGERMRLPADWQYTNESVYLEAASKLDAAAGALWDQYAAFIKLCRIHLRVEIT